MADRRQGRKGADKMFRVVVLASGDTPEHECDVKASCAEEARFIVCLSEKVPYNKVEVR